MKANSRQKLYEDADNMMCPLVTTQGHYEEAGICYPRYWECRHRRCMLWREQKSTNPDDPEVWIGWCGLAGSPSEEGQ